MATRVQILRVQILRMLRVLERVHLPSRVARTRQTRRHSPKAIFEKNVTCLAKFARVTCESRKFGTSGNSLVLP